MNESKDTQDVLMTIKNTAIFMDPFFRITTIGGVMLVTFLARMVKEKLLTKGSFTNFTKFCKLNDGEYMLVNLPLSEAGEKDIELMAEQLKNANIAFCQLPDLNASDGYIQLAVAEKDKRNFSVWYEGYLRSHMEGGEHCVRELNRLAGNQTSIISIPFEGEEELYQADFDILQVNYAKLPDLRVGDGEIQLVVANTDMQKVRQWYELYQQDQLKKGNPVPDMKEMDMGSYTATGEMNEEEYVDTASEEYQQANQKYEREEGAFEKETKESFRNHIRKEDCASYMKYERDSAYQKFTINKASLVDGTDKCEGVPSGFFHECDAKGFFVSRIPGTYGKNIQYLLVDKEQVFQSLDGQTYTAFIGKGTTPLVLDAKLNPVSITERKTAEELFSAHYDLSNRERQTTQDIRKQAYTKSQRIPQNPVKAK